MTEHSERRDEEAAHDILAADEFGIGARENRYPGDPSGIGQPHDVLAADEFAMPASDERLADPSGIHEPHDVLAAEEFAMPGGGDATRRSQPAPGRDPRTLLALTLAALLALAALRRRRS